MISRPPTPPHTAPSPLSRLSEVGDFCGAVGARPPFSRPHRFARYGRTPRGFPPLDGGRSPEAVIPGGRCFGGGGGAATDVAASWRTGTRAAYVFSRALTCSSAVTPPCSGALFAPRSPPRLGRPRPGGSLGRTRSSRCMRLVPGAEGSMTALLAVECGPRRTAILPTECMKWAARTSCRREPFQVP